MSLLKGRKSVKLVNGGVPVGELSPPTPKEQTSSHFGKPFPSKVEEIPKFLTQAFEYVEEFGSQTKGIFREAPDQEVFQSALSELERFDFIDYTTGPHVAAAIIKHYFAKLSDPLFTFECYPKFVASVGISNRTARGKMLLKQVQNLSPGHQKGIQMLVQLLHNITMFSDVNGMTSFELAQIFATDVLKSNNSKSPTDPAQSLSVLQTMVEESVTLFGKRITEDGRKEEQNTKLVQRVLIENEFAIDQKETLTQSPTNTAKIIRGGSGRFSARSVSKKYNL